MAENRAENRSVEQIEHEIAETRSQLGHTVDVLREKVSPRYIRDRAFNRFRPRGGVIDRVRASVQRNPLLYSLLASALAWRMFAGRRREVHLSRRDLDRLRAELAALYAREQSHRARAAWQGRRSLGQMQHEMARFGGDIQHRAQDRARQLRDQWYHYQSSYMEQSSLPGLLGTAIGIVTQGLMSRRKRSGRASTRIGASPGYQRPVEPMPESVATEETGFSAAGSSRGPGAPPSPGLEEPKRPVDR